MLREADCRASDGLRDNAGAAWQSCNCKVQVSRCSMRVIHNAVVHGPTGEYRFCPLSPFPVSHRHLDVNQACLELLEDKASLRKARYALLDAPCVTLPDLR